MTQLMRLRLGQGQCRQKVFGAIASPEILEHVLGLSRGGGTQCLDEFVHAIGLCKQSGILSFQSSKPSLSRIYGIFADVVTLVLTASTSWAGAIALPEIQHQVATGWKTSERDDTFNFLMRHSWHAALMVPRLDLVDLSG